MSDDPNKKHNDGWFVSTQPYEIDYFINSMQNEFPGKTRAAISAALLSARKTIAHSEGREKLKSEVRRLLRS